MSFAASEGEVELRSRTISYACWENQKGTNFKAIFLEVRQLHLQISSFNDLCYSK